MKGTVIFVSPVVEGIIVFEMVYKCVSHKFCEFLFLNFVMTTLDAGAVTLLQLFQGEKQYISPLFQRRYVWGKKEIESLWDGIDPILDGEDAERFLGALVLEVKNAGSAFKPDSSWIVDGQQRLTTLYVTLMVLAKIAIENEMESFGDDILKKFIFNQGLKYKWTPKISPTLTDFRQFNSLFLYFEKNLTPVLQQSYGDEKGDLIKAFFEIEDNVTRRCFIDGIFDEEIFQKIAEVILEKLSFVQIILGDQHNSHQVFDSLNSKGIKLENKDLIRNLVFEKLSDQPALAESTYQTKWLPLEEGLSEKFDGYFFPFMLVDKPSSTKSNLLPTLRIKWRDMDAYQIIQDLNKHVNTYKALVFPDRFNYASFSDFSVINEKMRLLAKMKVPSSVYPFIFKMIDALRAEALSMDDVSKNISIIESFLVRRSLAGFEPTGLHAVFKDLWNETKGVHEQVFNALISKKTIQFPEDEQFDLDIKSKPLYGRKLAPYIILQYERSFDIGDVTNLDAEFEIDHVLPQSIGGEWLNSFDPDSHKKYVDLWCNLVPLTKSGNIQKSKKNWVDAKVYLGRESVFKSTRHLAENYQEWNVESLERRSNEISEWAKQRWPRKII